MTLRDLILAQQVPLNSKPNQPFPVGNYTLRAQTPDGWQAFVLITLK
jgi:hypothetical protein